MRFDYRAFFVACVAMTAAWGCADPSPVDRLATESTAIGEDQNGSPVFVTDSGHWSNGIGDGATDENFWVDLSIRNDAYQKTVGIVWTADGWKTQTTTPAQYEASLAGGRERWGVDELRFVSTAPWLPPVEVEYAAFATMNGVTSWSPFRNHYIYQPVSPSHPVRRLQSSVSLANGAVTLTGSARALNVSGTRRVFVRYSVDGWQSFGDVEAAFNGKDFDFQIPLTSVTASTETVEVAIRLEASGQTAWDNADGKNYQHRLAPALVSAAVQNDPGRAANGIRLYGGAVTTALPVDQMWVHIDGGPRVALSLMPVSGYFRTGFSPDGNSLYPFDSGALTVGTHSIAIEAAAGPFARTFASTSFRVEHGIVYRSAWSVPPVGMDSNWDFAVDLRGNVYFGGNDGVHSFVSFGSSTPSTDFDPPPIAGTFMDVAVDDAFRVYGLSAPRLIRWLPSGFVDNNFGSRGVIDLTAAPLGTSTVCWPANIEVNGPYLVVVDSCNARVLRLTLDGGFVDELSLAGNFSYANVTTTFREGDDVWVDRTTETNDVWSHDLVRLAVNDGQGFRVLETRSVDARILNVDAIAVRGANVWVTDFSGNLMHLAPSGQIDATWLGGSGYVDLNGGLGIAKHIEPLSDTDVAVLSVEGNRVVTFGRP